MVLVRSCSLHNIGRVGQMAFRMSEGARIQPVKSCILHGVRETDLATVLIHPRVTPG